ncbi:TerC family protein [Anaerocolumna xylanovorans]|uniref:Integral membrane protein, YjbE family n=1 Tax=Anaerocolumna xylanovorans DSM 12503 TaxID=1121345 RepID=A0A1M7YJE2_9FIRM|nr:hypothetical protein [Anaerocolumna xylanovorans]SHO52721.1 integral membrane protein, YjbE family [Anaerocolumna xylanovorans DSM 12503]
MSMLFVSLLKILHIAVLNIILSFDNISVIAFVAGNLNEYNRKKAYLSGFTLSLVFSILFTSIISVLMEIKWLPIQPLGGFLLIKITYDMLKASSAKSGQKDGEYKVNYDMKLSRAIIKLTFISLSLSFDNILAIAGAADGDIRIISLGLLLSLPILLISCRYFMSLLKRYIIILYFCGAVLVHTSLEMIFSYPLIFNILPPYLHTILSLAASMALLIYGVYRLKKNKNSTIEDIA